MSRLCGIAAFLAVVAPSLHGADWPAFRGPRGDGTTAERDVALRWGADRHVRWKAALPRPGNGSPIVSNGRVFVNSAEDPNGTRRSLYCFDRTDGKRLWKRTIGFGRKMRTHDANPYGASTPAADRERVVTWHGSAGLHCYAFDGEKLWSRNLGDVDHEWGYAASPVIDGGGVYLNRGPGPKTAMMAFDIETGETLWKTPEPLAGDGEKREDGRYVGTWSTPILTEADGEKQLVATMPSRVVGYDPATGEILWWCDGLSHRRGNLAYSSPMIAGNVCVAVGGFRGPGMGIRLGGEGDVTETHRLWRRENFPQSIGSGVVVDGYLYLAFGGPNILMCIDPTTGEAQWKARGPGAPYWGSIVVADGRCYVTDKRGATHVFRPSPDGLSVVATNKLGEPCDATPAISEGQIFIRTDGHLWCIGDG